MEDDFAIQINSLLNSQNEDKDRIEKEIARLNEELEKVKARIKDLENLVNNDLRNSQKAKVKKTRTNRNIRQNVEEILSIRGKLHVADILTELHKRNINIDIISLNSVLYSYSKNNKEKIIFLKKRTYSLRKK